MMRQELKNTKITIDWKLMYTINKHFYLSQKNTNFIVPNDAMVQGYCSSIVSEMTLSWKEGKTDNNNTIKFTFINDHTNFTVFSIDLNIYKDKDKFPNGEKHNVYNFLIILLHFFPLFFHEYDVIFRCR